MDDFIAVGDEELQGLPALGTVVRCWVCGEEHPVESGLQVLPDGSTMAAPGELAFFKCGGEVYLCGIGGRAWRPKNEVESDRDLL